MNPQLKNKEYGGAQVISLGASFIPGSSAGP